MPDLYCMPLEDSLARVRTRLPFLVVTWPADGGEEGEKEGGKKERGWDRLTGFIPL